MIYLDSCALVKLAIVEPESDALLAWLKDGSGAPLLSSSLIRVEVPRSVMRRQPAAILQARTLVAKTRRIPMTTEILDTAMMLQPTSLGPLDAIHLASAFSVAKHLTAFVSYDQRLLDAASAARLPVVSPN
jgi:predicted nucleic acid-binding protein